MDDLMKLPLRVEISREAVKDGQELPELLDEIGRLVATVRGFQCAYRLADCANALAGLDDEGIKSGRVTRLLIASRNLHELLFCSDSKPDSLAVGRAALVLLEAGRDLWGVVRLDDDPHEGAD